MAINPPTAESLAALKGRRFRLVKDTESFRAGQTGIVSSIYFHNGFASVEVEWELPGTGRIPQTTLFYWRKFHELLCEC